MSEPIAPPAPGRLSTMSWVPSASPIFCDRVRANRSVACCRKRHDQPDRFVRIAGGKSGWRHRRAQGEAEDLQESHSLHGNGFCPPRPGRLAPIERRCRGQDFVDRRDAGQGHSQVRAAHRTPCRPPPPGAARGGPPAWRSTGAGRRRRPPEVRKSHPAQVAGHAATLAADRLEGRWAGLHRRLPGRASGSVGWRRGRVSRQCGHSVRTSRWAITR